ncbi:MAG TPA: extradiol ring-cleavage dioxygenase [Chloroflexota bacterium]|nr:extradiol ring-cleavage dioxygenase [Chloroflexota bacterium]
MAQIVLGIGSSHTPQLNTPPEIWPLHGENDKKNPWLFDRQGRRVSYDEVLAQADPNIPARELAPEKQRERWEGAQKAVSHLQDKLAEADPDVIVVFGDDQAEIFPHDFRPALMVHWGETVPNMPDLFSRAPYEAGRKAGWAYGPERATIPIRADLGKHIVDALIDGGFDVASSKKLDNDMGLGHAYGFIFGRIMNGKTVPMVPVILNTLYPPNQPTAARCYELGRTVRKAIEDWPVDARVAIAGSGGLSHFVIDEEIDEQFMAALRSKKAEDFAALPRERLESGTGELRSWTGAAGALEGLDLTFMDYYPCYRSPAGTGVAMGFAVWE